MAPPREDLGVFRFHPAMDVHQAMADDALEQRTSSGL
jgi:hypothetical protein